MQYVSGAPNPEAKVPSVRVSLVQSVHLLPHQRAVVDVKLSRECSPREPLLFESDIRDTMLQVDDSVLQPSKEGVTQVVIANPTGCSCTWDEGTDLGEATSITVIEPEEEQLPLHQVEESDVAADHPDIKRVESSLDRLTPAVTTPSGRELLPLPGSCRYAQVELVQRGE